MVNGAKRFHFITCPGGDDTTLAGFRSASEQGAKDAGGDTRHVASHDQVPVRSGYAQGRVNASQGSTAGEFVWINRMAEARVSARLPNQCYGAGRLLHHPRQ